MRLSQLKISHHSLMKIALWASYSCHHMWTCKASRVTATMWTRWLRIRRRTSTFLVNRQAGQTTRRRCKSWSQSSSSLNNRRRRWWVKVREWPQRSLSWRVLHLCVLQLTRNRNIRSSFRWQRWVACRREPYHWARIALTASLYTRCSRPKYSASEDLWLPARSWLNKQ